MSGFINNALRCIRFATDVGEWQLVGGFPLKLCREFPFQGFHEYNARMAVYRGVLFWDLTVQSSASHVSS
jgi:hypothetical protein